MKKEKIEKAKVFEHGINNKNGKIYFSRQKNFKKKKRVKMS